MEIILVLLFYFSKYGHSSVAAQSVLTALDEKQN